MAEADITVCAFNQTRNIGNGSAAISRKIDYPNDRMQCRERIRRDLRPGRGDFSKEGRFARVRITNETGIGDCAQLQ